jgi:hypothetical protein
MPGKDPLQAKPQKQEWRSAAPTPAGRRKPTSNLRRQKAFALGAIILALIGAIAAWVFFVRPLDPPYFLTIPVSEYTAADLPINSFAEQDSDALLKHFADHGVGKKAFESQVRRRLVEEFDTLRNRSDAPVVVHLRAHALWREGKVQILPGDADLDDPSTWLSLDEVLQAIGRCQTKHKLLILDLMRPVADPALGILTDEVARHVQELLDKQTPSFFVLSACSRGQVSHVSEEEKLSVFGHYLERGLRGHADGFGANGKTDGRVSVSELAEFVRQYVDRWAVQNRGGRQTPYLAGKADDFALVSFDRKSLAATEETPPGEPYPAWLSEEWKRRDQWLADDSYRFAPRIFRRFEASLLRAEQRWRGGIDSARLRGDLSSSLTVHREQIEGARKLAMPKALSVGNPEGVAAKEPREAQDALRTLLKKLDAMPPKPDDLMKLRTEIQEKAKTLSADLLGRTLFDVALRQPEPTAGQLIVWDELQRFVEPTPRFAETLFLRRLAEFAREMTPKIDAGEWPKFTIRSALEVTNLATQAAEFDPRLLPWLEEKWQQADDRRRNGLNLLFTPDSRVWRKGQMTLSEAVTLYQDLLDRGKQLKRAYDALDRAMVLLPGHYLAEKAQVDAGLPRDAAFSDAVRAAVNLQVVLARPDPKALPSSEEFRTPAAKLERLLTTLAERHSGARAAKILRKGDEVSPADCQEVEALLASPIPGAKERMAVLNAALTIEHTLYSQTWAKDVNEEGDNSAAGVPSTFDGAVAVQQEQSRGAARAALSMDLLKLGGFVETTKLEASLAAARREPREVVITALAGGLRHAWVEELPRQFRTEKDRATKERLAYILLPSDRDLGRTSTGKEDPAAQARKQEYVRYWQWMARRYQADAQSSAYAGRPVFAKFFTDAAEEYQRQAGQ